MPDKFVFPPTSIDIPDDIKEAVMSAVHSKNDHYQFGLMVGKQCWSGGDLRGKAREYAGRYETSRRHLLLRINDKLKSFGWYANLGHVMISSRWNSRLILHDNKGNAVDWITEKRLEEK